MSETAFSSYLSAPSTTEPLYPLLLKGKDLVLKLPRPQENLYVHTCRQTPGAVGVLV